jgi:hypothetical protein
MVKVWFDSGIPKDSRIVWAENRFEGRCHPVWAEQLYNAYALIADMATPSQIMPAGEFRSFPILIEGTADHIDDYLSKQSYAESRSV